MSVHVHPSSNTLAITTTNTLLTSRPLTIKRIPIGSQEEIAEVTPYQALSSNECRGVIYLSRRNTKETLSSLMRDIVCETQRIIAAWPLGKTGRTILIAFKAKTPPKRVIYYEMLPVSGYNPRLFVSYSNHQLEHKADAMEQ